MSETASNSMAVTDASSDQMREGALIEEDLEGNLYVIRLDGRFKCNFHAYLPETKTPFCQCCISSSICCLREEEIEG